MMLDTTSQPTSPPDPRSNSQPFQSWPDWAVERVINATVSMERCWTSKTNPSRSTALYSKRVRLAHQEWLIDDVRLLEQALANQEDIQIYRAREPDWSCRSLPRRPKNHKGLCNQTKPKR